MEPAKCATVVSLCCSRLKPTLELGEPKLPYETLVRKTSVMLLRVTASRCTSAMISLRMHVTNSLQSVCITCRNIQLHERLVLITAACAELLTNSWVLGARGEKEIPSTP